MIVVFGSINVDLTARVERFPLPGETIAGLSFVVVAGGKGANQALAARRAGAAVAMVGAIGNDAFASTGVADLADAGVDIRPVRRIDGPTGIAVIVVDARGQNSIVVVPGANRSIAAEDLDDSVLGPGTTLVVQLEVPLAAVTGVTHRARARGARVVLNAAPAMELPATLLSAIDVLIVNEHEAEALAAACSAPSAPESFAAEMHRRFRCAVAVTLGARGALAIVDDGKFLRAAAPPVAVVDTTGAGDALVGALAAALDRGAFWPRALAEGVAAGSLACEVAGAQAALPMAGPIAALAAQVEATIADSP
ncbi:MAG TPA: ribokinase [Casimicrobiaceae bacterium]|nr:ribokinase [Casimicrobiaceae bacterium]